MELVEIMGKIGERKDKDSHSRKWTSPPEARSARVKIERKQLFPGKFLFLFQIYILQICRRENSRYIRTFTSIYVT